MSKPPESKSDKSYIVPIVTALFVLIGTLATVYFSYMADQDAVLIPIMITQTAEARLETRIAGQTASTSTIILLTETLTELSSRELTSNTDTPLTPTPSPIMWEVFSSDGTSFEPLSFEDCSNIAVNELGFFTSNCNLIFGKSDIKQHGVYGLSMPIQRNITIQVSVIVRNLIEGEFWIGFSNGINPQSGSLIYAIPPDPGGVDVYLNNISSRNARYAWAPMGEDIGWVYGQPWRYNFTIKLDGNNVSVGVNSTSFATVTALSTNRLFLGYRSKPEQIGTYVDVTISGLIITNNP